MNHQENYYDGNADYFGDELELEYEFEEDADYDDEDEDDVECTDCAEENRHKCDACGHFSPDCESCDDESHNGCLKCEAFRDERDPCSTCNHYLNCEDCPEEDHYSCNECDSFRDTRTQCPTCFHFDSDCAGCDDERHENEGDAQEEQEVASADNSVLHDFELYIATHAFENKTAPPSEQPGNHLAYWTRESDEVLVEAYNNGVDFAEIANELNRTRNAVLGRLVKLCFGERGIDLRSGNYARADLSNHGTPWADAEWQFLSFLHSKNETLDSMSLSLKRSVSAVAYGLVELRLVEPVDLSSVSYFTPKNEYQKARKPWGMADTSNLLLYFRSGEDIEALARRFDRTVASVLMKLMSMGELTSVDFDLALDNSRKRNQGF